jgi:ParB/RepB/Spo0J family partition protein
MVLAESMKQIGLLQPISVREVDGLYEIIAGGHRLAAAKILEWRTIPGFIRADSDLQAELALIDENLIRNELSPAERGAAMDRRKRVYEALHPETAHGGDRKSSRQLSDLKPGKPKSERFAKATAKATGTSERAVQRDASRGETLGEATLARI